MHALFMPGIDKNWNCIIMEARDSTTKRFFFRTNFAFTDLYSSKLIMLNPEYID